MLQKYFSLEMAARAGMDPTRFPRTDDEVQKAEEIIARELDKLSIEEHEKILFDMHGIPINETTHSSSRYDKSLSFDLSGSESSIATRSTSSLYSYSEEDHSQLQESLESLEREIQSLMDKNCVQCDAYVQAKEWNEKYVCGEAFHLMCLWAKQMQPQPAAELLLQHFQVKRELFGNEPSLLGRDVYLSDLSAEEQDILRLGNMQLLPTQDAAGRTILVYRCRKYPSIESLVRRGAMDDPVRTRASLILLCLFLQGSLSLVVRQ